MIDGLHLGKDPQGGQAVAIPPDRLRTHGVVVGMTGSGKTGLCLVVLEELVRAGIPVIAIDPKGDLGNLGLLFPASAPDDFAPWCGAEDPAAVARGWQQGMLRSGLTAAHVAELRARMALTVYTPGSTAGVPVDLLGMLRAPDDLEPESEEAQELVAGTVSSLLGLVGRRADPVKDPAHVVLSHILARAWAARAPVDLATLVLQLVDPPFEKVGVFPLDRFFPPDDRMDLAMAFNALLAAPSFGVWSQGAPLDPERLLARGDRAPVSVFSVAHLDEGQRHFFVGLLLTRLLAWSRRQPGTDGLRAVLFFDEVAGYLPPHPANPAPKAPLLTLMKQARAVGLGVLLATQNPVDLDYKALSNAGLWCIGRLTTEQDRARLLKGLEAEGLAPTVAGLEKRQFLLHQVGRGAPEVFATRHAMCYLRGPLTRPELGRLNALWGVEAPPPAALAPPPTRGAPAAPAGSAVPPGIPGVDAFYLDPRVAFSARMDGVFEAHAGPKTPDGKQAFAPALYADLRLRFDEERAGGEAFVVDRRLARVFFPLEDRLPEAPLPVRLEPQDLLQEPPGEATYRPLPAWMDEAKELAALQKRILDDVFRTEHEGQFLCRPLKLHGRAGETEAEFRQRCEAEVQARVDEEVAKLEDRFQAKAAKLQERLAAKGRKLAEQEGLARSRQLDEAMNIGTTLLSFFGGRKRGLGSAVSKRRQSAQAGARVDQTEAEIEALQAEAAALETELSEAVEAIEARHRRALDALESRAVRLEREDVRVEAFGVLWVPVTRRV
jgi:hypothetical protein